jgi:glycosyl transferase, family 25
VHGMRTWVINLPDRPDRRQEITDELARVGWPGPVEWIAALRPSERGEFPTIGYRGCFLSHMKAMVEARRVAEPVCIVLEDDCEFVAEPARIIGTIAALERYRWDFCYLGYCEVLATEADENGLGVLPPHLRATGSHCYAVHRPALDDLLDTLDRISCRTAGNPLGGPQSPDGGFNTWRVQNPERITLAALPALAGQRSSRSDVSPQWFDRVPGLRELAAAARRWR